MENLKMIIMDMDGTLLNQDGIITPRTYEALVNAQKKGVKVVLASGRSYKTLTDFGIQLKMDQYEGYFIGVNGAAISEVKTMTHHVIAQLQKEDIKKIFLEAQPYEIEIMGVLDSTIYDYIPSSLREIKRQYRIENQIADDVPWTGGTFKLVTDQRKGYSSIYDIQSWEDIPCAVNKMTLCHQADVLADVYPKLVDVLSNDYNLNRTSPQWIEIAPKNISKGNAIALLQNHLNISKEETFVFGDGENDLSMFDYGVSVAMGNAMESVKKRADLITDDNNHDGIALVIEKYL
ncbi:MAG: Cof-type HAD-IIB family hydrolase [Traorella sp.]